MVIEYRMLPNLTEICFFMIFSALITNHFSNLFLNVLKQKVCRKKRLIISQTNFWFLFRFFTKISI